MKTKGISGITTKTRAVLALLGAVFMQLCLGATYSWSVFVGPVREISIVTQAEAQIPFTVFYFIFPSVMLFSGRILSWLGPRLCAFVGAFFFGGGWLLASMGENNFLLVILGIGVLAGIGAGLAYIVPITTCIRWFPNNKGLVTGIAVAGFGGGAALVSKTAGWLILKGGYSPFTTFGILGGVFFLLIVLSSMVMVYPVEKGIISKEQGTMSLWSLISDKGFWPLYLGMFAGLAAGFSINANLQELNTAGNIQVGVNGVAAFALCNGLGRVCWGFVADRMVASRILFLNLCSQMILVVLFSVCSTSADSFLAFCALAGFNYGGVLVLYALTVATRWGSEKVGQVYGLVFSANIPAAFAPIIAGRIYDVSGDFSSFLLVIAALLGLSAVIIWRSSSNLMKRKEDCYPDTKALQETG